MKDLISAFFRELDIESAESFDEILEDVAMRFGEDTVEQIESIVYGPQHDGMDAELFSLINSDPDLAVTVFGGVDGAYYKKLFRNIQKNSAFFGREIIDVGCGCGITTCFLASLFPESHVTGIDILESFAGVGTALAERLGLSNVEFRTCDLRKVTEKYDTVFVSRVSSEYIGHGMETIDFDDGNRQIAWQFEHLFTEYARKIKAMLNDGGTVVSADTIPYTMGIHGLCSAFARVGIAPDLSTYTRIICMSLGEREAVPFFCCRMGRADTDLMEQFFDEVFVRETAQDDDYYERGLPGIR